MKKDMLLINRVFSFLLSLALSLILGVGDARVFADGIIRASSDEIHPALKSSGPFLVHIQDAHANPDAQNQIHEILKSLNAEFHGNMIVAVEGAAGPLHPEYVNLFSQYPDIRQRMIDDMVSKGELTGAELFALDQYQLSLRNDPRLMHSGMTDALKHSEMTDMSFPQSVGGNQALDQYKRYQAPFDLTLSFPQSVGGNQAFDPRLRNSGMTKGKSRHYVPVIGVETPRLYRENLYTYRSLLFKRDEIDGYLQSVRKNLELAKSLIFSPELRRFIRERERRKEGEFGSSVSNPQFDVYLRFLAEEASHTLAIDLADSIEQIRFPNLVRVMAFGRLEKEIDFKEADREKTAFAKHIDITPIEQSRDPRIAAEALRRYALERKISLAGYGNYLKKLGLHILLAEIDSDKLFDEVNLLEKGLIEKLSRSQKEKDLIQILDDFSLLTKTLHLELSAEEYRQILAKKREVTADAILRRLSQLENEPGSFGPAGLRMTKEKQSRHSELPQAKLRSEESRDKMFRLFFDKSLYFYALATKRDRALLENTIRQIASLTTFARNDIPEEAVKRAVIARPKAEAISHPLVVLITGGFHTPGLLEQIKARGLGYAVVQPRIREADRGELYRQVLRGEHEDLSAYFGKHSLNRQAALLLKEILETALPGLREKQRGAYSKIAFEAAQAINQNPVLSKKIKAAAGFLKDHSALTLTPRLPAVQGAPQTGIPMSTQAIPAALIEGEKFDFLWKSAGPELFSAGTFSRASLDIVSKAVLRSEVRGATKMDTHILSENENVKDYLRGYVAAADTSMSEGGVFLKLIPRSRAQQSQLEELGFDKADIIDTIQKIFLSGAVLKVERFSKDTVLKIEFKTPQILLLDAPAFENIQLVSSTGRPFMNMSSGIKKLLEKSGNFSKLEMIQSLITYLLNGQMILIETPYYFQDSEKRDIFARALGIPSGYFLTNVEYERTQGVPVSEPREIDPASFGEELSQTFRTKRRRPESAVERPESRSDGIDQKDVRKALYNVLYLGMHNDTSMQMRFTTNQGRPYAAVDFWTDKSSPVSVHHDEPLPKPNHGIPKRVSYDHMIDKLKLLIDDDPLTKEQMREGSITLTVAGKPVQLDVTFHPQDDNPPQVFIDFSFPEGKPRKPRRSELREKSGPVAAPIWEPKTREKIAVIGTGFVGTTHAVLLVTDFGQDVIGADIQPAITEKLNAGDTVKVIPELKPLLREALDSGRLRFTTDYAEALEGRDIIFLAVGTPSIEKGPNKGTADTRYLEEAVKTIVELVKDGEEKIIVIKSTVPPTVEPILKKSVEDVFAQRESKEKFSVRPVIHFAREPEFTREGSEVNDHRSGRIVIGAGPKTPEVAERLKGLYQKGNRNPEYRSQDQEIIVMSPASAASTKYWANAYRAGKISLINLIGQLAEEIGLDVQKIAGFIGKDPRILPGFLVGGVGFGGSCFSKDILALMMLAYQLGVPHDLFLDILAINEGQWRRFSRRIINDFGDDLHNKEIAVLGGSFKPETDDIRDARSIKITHELEGAGAHIMLYDPVATKNLQNSPELRDDDIDYYPDNGMLEDMLLRAGAIVLVTEWKIFESIDFAALKAKREAERKSLPRIYDGRNLWSSREGELRAIGYSYQGIGRSQPGQEIKITENEFNKMANEFALAFKLVMINLAKELADKTEANIRDLREGWGTDPVVGLNYFNPGPGFGGLNLPGALAHFGEWVKRYLPKGLEEYRRVRATIAEEYGITLDPKVEAVRIPYVTGPEAINERQIGLYLEKAREAAGGDLNGQKAAVLGVAFKSGTSAVKNSPSLKLIQALLDAGAFVAATDANGQAVTNARRLAEEEKFRGREERLSFVSDAREAVKGSVVQIVATDSPEYKSLTENSAEYDGLRRIFFGEDGNLLPARANLVDARHFFEPEQVAALGINYYSVGVQTLKAKTSGVLPIGPVEPINLLVPPPVLLDEVNRYLAAHVHFLGQSVSGQGMGENTFIVKADMAQSHWQEIIITTQGLRSEVRELLRHRNFIPEHDLEEGERLIIHDVAGSAGNIFSVGAIAQRYGALGASEENAYRYAVTFVVRELNGGKLAQSEGNGLTAGESRALGVDFVNHFFSASDASVKSNRRLILNENLSELPVFGQDLKLKLKYLANHPDLVWNLDVDRSSQNEAVRYLGELLKQASEWNVSLRSGQIVIRGTQIPGFAPQTISQTSRNRLLGFFSGSERSLRAVAVREGVAYRLLERSSDPLRQTAAWLLAADALRSEVRDNLRVNIMAAFDFARDRGFNYEGMLESIRRFTIAA